MYYTCSCPFWGLKILNETRLVVAKEDLSHGIIKCALGATLLESRMESYKTACIIAGLSLRVIAISVEACSKRSLVIIIIAWYVKLVVMSL